LAAKAKALAEVAPDDPVAPRLRELSDKLTRDAELEEREARALTAEQEESHSEEDQSGSRRPASTSVQQSLESK
jgi:hypothetical protein